MTAFALPATYRDRKIPGIALSGAEDVITVSTNGAPAGAPQAQASTMSTRFGGNMPQARATVQFIGTAAWGYHSVAGQVATDAYPVAANQPITLILADGDVFYVLGTGTLHALVVTG